MGNWHAKKQHPGNDDYRLDWTVYEGEIEVAIGYSADAAQQMVRHNNHVADLTAEVSRLKGENDEMMGHFRNVVGSLHEVEHCQRDGRAAPTGWDGCNLGWCRWLRERLGECRT